MVQPRSSSVPVPPHVLPEGQSLFEPHLQLPPLHVVVPPSEQVLPPEQVGVAPVEQWLLS